MGKWLYLVLLKWLLIGLNVGKLRYVNIYIVNIVLIFLYNKGFLRVFVWL